MAKIYRFGGLKEVLVPGEEGDYFVKEVNTNLQYSDDGTNWTTITPTGLIPTGVDSDGYRYLCNVDAAFFSNKLLLLGYSDALSLANRNVIHSSDNGATWTTNSNVIPLAASSSPSHAIKDGELVKFLKGTEIVKSVSNNGTTFGAVGAGLGNISDISSVCYYNNYFWYIAGTEVFKGDGISPFTKVGTTPVSGFYGSRIIVFNNMMVVVYAKPNKIYVSTDGINWTEKACPTISGYLSTKAIFSNDSYDTAYYLGVIDTTLYLGIADKLYFTTNLTNWTLKKDFTDGFQSVAYIFESSPATTPTALEITNARVTSVSSINASVSAVTEGVQTISNISISIQSALNGNILINMLSLSSSLIPSISNFAIILANSGVFTIEGYVNIGGSTIGNANVIAINENTGVIQRALTNENGRYQFNVPNGVYHIICVYKDTNGVGYTSLAKAYITVSD